MFTLRVDNVFTAVCLFTFSLLILHFGSAHFAATPKNFKVAGWLKKFSCFLFDRFAEFAVHL